MKRVAGLLLAAAIGVMAIDALADATQTRPERVRPGSATAITLDVSLREERDAIHAAEALWGACQWMVRRTLVEPGIQQIGDHRFRLVVRPEVGSKGRQRLRGCLEDAAIDRIQGRVVAMEPVSRAQNP